MINTIMTENNKDISKFYNNLHKSYITLRNNIEDFIEEQIEQVKGVNKDLTDELEQCKSEVDNLRKVSIVSNLNKQIDTLTKNNEDLSKKNCKQQNIITKLNIELEKLRDELENNKNKADIDEIDNNEIDNNESDNSENIDDDELDYSENTDEEEGDIYEVEINDKTYTINSNNEILDDESYDIIGKLINNMPYIYLDCCYNITGAIYERNNVNIKIGKLSKKYLIK